jgi:predicted lipoprotein with Yx(FWY)xxD motif
MTSGRIKVLGLAAVFALLMAACGNDDEPTGGAQPSPTEESESPTPSEEPAAAATIEVTEDEELGEFVVDAEGRSLYVFLADEGTASTCYEDCEATWPPLTVEGDPVAGTGIDQALLATSEREDGAIQVTLDGHPLYYFASDAAPGDTNGQGIGDVWFVVAPTGEAIQG